MKFKVGDLVKFTSESSLIMKGWVGVVVNVGSVSVYVVDFGQSGSSFFACVEAELELVE